LKDEEKDRGGQGALEKTDDQVVHEDTNGAMNKRFYTDGPE